MLKIGLQSIICLRGDIRIKKKNHLILLIKLVLGALLKGSVHETFIAGLFDKKLYLSKIMSANRCNGLHFSIVNESIKSLNKCVTGERSL